MAWQNWAKGLIAAIIGGTATTITVVILDPLKFNLQTGLSNLLQVMAVSAIINGAFYLKDHPVPDAVTEVKETTTKTTTVTSTPPAPDAPSKPPAP